MFVPRALRRVRPYCRNALGLQRGLANVGSVGAEEDEDAVADEGLGHWASQRPLAACSALAACQDCHFLDGGDPKSVGILAFVKGMISTRIITERQCVLFMLLYIFGTNNQMCETDNTADSVQIDDLSSQCDVVGVKWKESLTFLYWPPVLVPRTKPTLCR